MKKIMTLIILVIAAYVTAASHRAEACVGKTLAVGIVSSSKDQLLAEILSVLINERTGATVTINVYKNVQEVYRAVKKGGEISILIENTERALEVLNRPAEKDVKKAYAISKEEFRKHFDLVWLQPFGLFLQHGETNSIYWCFAIATDTLNNFPALPRLLNKLAGTLNEEAFATLMKKLDNGGNPAVLAKDFLKSKKLI